MRPGRGMRPGPAVRARVEGGARVEAVAPGAAIAPGSTGPPASWAPPGPPVVTSAQRLPLGLAAICRPGRATGRQGGGRPAVDRPAVRRARHEAHLHEPARLELDPVVLVGHRLQVGDRRLLAGCRVGGGRRAVRGRRRPARALRRGGGGRGDGHPGGEGRGEGPAAAGTPGPSAAAAAGIGSTPATRAATRATASGDAAVRDARSGHGIPRLPPRGPPGRGATRPAGCSDRWSADSVRQDSHHRAPASPSHRPMVPVGPVRWAPGVVRCGRARPPRRRGARQCSGSDREDDCRAPFGSAADTRSRSVPVRLDLSMIVTR